MDALKNKRILIVEDEEAARVLLTVYLEQQGCHVFYAVNGLDGIEKARLLQTDIILMDLDMPRCNGRDACKVITQDPRTKHIPVVFISNMASSEQRIRGLLAGAVDYITKPFDFNEVKLRLVIHLKHQSNTQITDVKPVADVANNSSTLQPQSHRQTVLFHNARVHLLNSLATTLSMAELEKLTCSNSKQLNMAFKICTGVTVFEYLREERMKEARQLLQQTQTPIQDIAYEVGFTNSANFSSAFKERFGLSPRTFRQQTN